MPYEYENEEKDKRLKQDKAKQFVALVGGFLSAIYFFLLTISVAFDWFTIESINAFTAVIGAGIPLALNLYGVYKNTYIVEDQARKQEEELIRKGLK